VRPYAKESPACVAFLEDIRAVYEKHGLAMPVRTLEHAVDGRWWAR
jgi:hypothetical protein